MSKEKAILLLEERGYFKDNEYENGLFYFVKQVHLNVQNKKDVGNFTFCLGDNLINFSFCFSGGASISTIYGVDLSKLSDKNLSSLEDSAILISLMINTFRGIKNGDKNVVLKKNTWKMRRVVSKNGFLHKFMLDHKVDGCKVWVKREEITIENIDRIKQLVWG